MIRALTRLALLAVASAFVAGSSCGISQGGNTMPSYATVRDRNEEKANCHLLCRDHHDECRAVCGEGTPDADRCMSNCETERIACDEAC